MNHMNPKLPPVTVDSAPGEDVPVRTLDPTEMAIIGTKLKEMFEEYKKDRSNAERNYVKNLRQFAGKYDPEIEQKLPPNMSKAYPRITRVKVLLTLARIMNLMFPGNEKNWEIKATPSADISPEDVMAKLQEIAQLDAAVAPEGEPGQAEQTAGMPPAQGPVKPKITTATVRAAVQRSRMIGRGSLRSRSRTSSRRWAGTTTPTSSRWCARFCGPGSCTAPASCTARSRSRRR